MTARRIAAVAAAAAVVLTGCGSTSDIEGADTPTAPVTDARVLDLPPGFTSLLTACHGATRIYLSEYGAGYSGSPLVVIADDPTCPVTPSTEGAAA